MTGDRLVSMANQIAAAFAHLPPAEAIAATEDHIKKFWDPRMRARLLDHLQSASGTPGLSDIARQAVERL